MRFSQILDPQNYTLNDIEIRKITICGCLRQYISIEASSDHAVCFSGQIWTQGIPQTHIVHARTSQKIFSRPSKSLKGFGKTLLLSCFYEIMVKMSIKCKKSSFPAVCVNNFRLKRRATTPLASEDRYGPKVTRKHTQYVL